MLRMNVTFRQIFWEKYFHLVELAYNNNVPILIGVNPFEVMYGQ